MARDKIYWSVITCMLLAFLACGCEPQPSNVGIGDEPSVEADASAIRAVWKQEMVSYNNGDVDGCADVTADAVFIPENSPPIMGQSAIRSWCGSMFEQTLFDDVNATIDELVVQDDWAFVVGTWRGQVQPKDGGDWIEIENGTIAIYRRQEDGAWKLARAIWNSNKPVD